MFIYKGTTTTCAMLMLVFFVLCLNSWCEYGEAARIFLDFSASNQVTQRLDGLGSSHRRSTRESPGGSYPAPAANVNDHVHH
ncbi:hypothetical protein RND71_037199 [Anisodus tanguticus]|uniref:Uncharacterized protein n=1 Tax=Anisodus tanguticus TaxID=243964 RepID=A0AAE1R2D7_9SOLA|nr:hypothetical protein RND71_037199 [Anisodus tanguticus]